MRLLWLKLGGLWPLNSGGRQRTFHMVSELARRHQVVLVTTAGPDDDPAGLAAQLPQCERVVSIPFAAPKQGTWPFVGAVVASWGSRYPVDLWRWRSPEVQRCIRALLGSPGCDAIVADFLCGAVNLPPIADVPVVFFEHNVEHLIWKRLAAVEKAPWRRALLALEWRKMRRCEVRACRAADVTVAVSPEDRDCLAAASKTSVAAVPTGVDTLYFAPDASAEVANRLVFSGSMDWYPNEDAMLFWAETILPRVRRQLPDVSLTIVGRHPGPAVRALANHAGIRVTGSVADVRPYVREAALYIVPLRVGGGTRLKIFEALAMAKAVVSTSIGAEGLDVMPGRHLEVADGADAFAERVVSLLNDSGRRAALGQEGRRLVEARYSWPQVTTHFERIVQGALSASPHAGAAGRRTFAPLRTER